MAGPLLRLPRQRGEGDRKPVVIAVALHVVLFLALSSVVAVPVLRLARAELRRSIVEERVTFIETSAARTEPVRDTARSQQRPPPPVTPPPSAGPPPSATALPVVPPTGAVPPSEIPPPGARTGGGGGDSTARRALAGGGLPGLVPGPKDPRLLGIGRTDRMLADSTLTINAPRPDSLVNRWVQAYWDSLARVQAGAGRRPGDWTVNRGDDRYGVDPNFIYFGKFKIPTALLALLPIRTTANPSVLERNRALESMRWEIEYQANRATSQASFQEAVKELRERTQKARAAAGKDH